MTRIDFTQPQTRQLHSVLVSQYWKDDQLVALAQQAGIDLGNIPFKETMRDTWQATLIALDRALEVDALLQTVLDDPRASTIHDTVRAFRTDVSSMVVPADQPGLRVVNEVEERSIFEKIMGSTPTFLDVSFLRSGVEASRAVCKLVATMDGDATRRRMGTGFLIAPDRLLTNHHVLFDAHSSLSELEVLFDYEAAPGGAAMQPRSVEAALETLVGEADGDWATIALAEPITDRRPLSFATQAVRLDDWIAIIQHPNGLPKKIAVHHNVVTHADGDIVQYLVDTYGGSSGSPVFNHDWQVVALHHAGGNLMVPGTRVPAYRNEGIAIAKVKGRLDALGIAYGA